MNRRAFLLGFYATGGQVLLLRELVSSLNGDELFIGTALFGWLVALAAGAWLGGRCRSGPSSKRLLAGGAVLLPAVIVITRLAPNALGGTTGEIVPFCVAAVISIVAMLPVAFLAGWLFPVITREGRTASASIVRVYFFEGVGAFVAGIAIVVLVGNFLSTLGTALVLSLIHI